jgi:hypothetical protein
MAYYLQFDGVDDYVSIPDPNRLDSTWELEIVFADISGRNSGTYSLLKYSGNTGTVLNVQDGGGLSNPSLNITYRVDYNYVSFGAVLTGQQRDIGDGIINKLNIIYDGTTYHASINGNTPTSVTQANEGFRIFDYLGDASVRSTFYSLKYWSDNTRTTLVHEYDPAATNGTGLVLTDTVGTNNGTLVNFPVDNSQWQSIYVDTTRYAFNLPNTRSYADAVGLFQDASLQGFEFLDVTLRFNPFSQKQYTEILEFHNLKVRINNVGEVRVQRVINTGSTSEIAGTFGDEIITLRVVCDYDPTDLNRHRTSIYVNDVFITSSLNSNSGVRKGSYTGDLDPRGYIGASADTRSEFNYTGLLYYFVGEGTYVDGTTESFAYTAPSDGIGSELINEVDANKNASLINFTLDGTQWVYYGGLTVPTANAGTDQSVSQGSTVTLDATGSTDSDGSIASYAWTQLSGTPVTLVNDTSAQATFTAPSFATGLTFQVTVTDDVGSYASDIVAVNTMGAAGNYYLFFDGNNDAVQPSPPIPLIGHFRVEMDLELQSRGDQKLLDSAGTARRFDINVRTNGALDARNYCHFEIEGVPVTSLPLDVRTVLTIIRDSSDSDQSDREIGNIGQRYSNTAQARMKLYGLSVDDSTGAALANLNPSESLGVGSTLPDVIGIYDGALINFPTDNSQWVFYGSVAIEFSALVGLELINLATFSKVTDLNAPIQVDLDLDSILSKEVSFSTLNELNTDSSCTFGKITNLSTLNELNTDFSSTFGKVTNLSTLNELTTDFSSALGKITNLSTLNELNTDFSNSFEKVANLTTLNEINTDFNNSFEKVSNFISLLELTTDFSNSLGKSTNLISLNELTTDFNNSFEKVTNLISLLELTNDFSTSFEKVANLTTLNELSLELNSTVEKIGSLLSIILTGIPDSTYNAIFLDMTDATPILLDNQDIAFASGLSTATFTDVLPGREIVTTILGSDPTITTGGADYGTTT